MAPESKHLEVTLETHVESVNLAEEMCLRVAESAGFGEDDCYRIGMSVREGVINAFHYGNQERPDKKIHLAVDITAEKMIIHVLDEGKGFDLSSVPGFNSRLCLIKDRLRTAHFSLSRVTTPISNRVFWKTASWRFGILRGMFSTGPTR